MTARLSEVTMKRGLARPGSHSALPTPAFAGAGSAQARPGLQGAIAELGEQALGLSALPRARLGPVQGRLQAGRKPRVARQAEDVVDPVVLAPSHQRLAGEARVGAEHDLHRRPTGADLPDDLRHLLDRAGAGVDVGAPQLGRQKVVAAEDVERQVAVAVVIAVEEAALLASVQRVVGGVEIEHQPLRRALVGVEKQVHEQRLDHAGVMADAPIAMRSLGRVLQTVQRRLARQRRTIPATRLQTAQNRAQNRIVAQLVLVQKVFVAQRNPEHALAHQRLHIVHHTIRRATVRKAIRNPLHQTYRPVRRPQKQRACVRGHRTAAEIGHNIAAFQPCKSHRNRVTLCAHRGTPLQPDKSLSQKNFLTCRAPMHLPTVRNAG